MKKSLRELCTAIAICFCATGNLFATDNQINTDHTMDKNYACRRYVQTQACGWKIACYRY